MTKEKKEKLVKYLALINNRLAEKTTPAKHAGHIETYVAYLKREAKIVHGQLEAERLDGSAK
jgi:hypothetical protein